MKAPLARHLLPFVTLLWVAAPSVAAEQVEAEFDLLGWSRLGGLEMESSPLQRGSWRDLIDRSHATTVQTADASATFTITFTSTHVVREVSVRPASRDALQVNLVVIGQDGRRFAAGESQAERNQPASFHLKDVATKQLEISVARVDGEGTCNVSEIRVSGELEVDRIDLENVPETLPEGGSFPVIVSGRDSLGGRPDLTALARLVAAPQRAVQVEGNRLITRAGGPVTITAHVGQLESQRRTLLVQKLEAAPPAPVARPGYQQVRLTFEGAPPFEVFRRAPGDKDTKSIGRADRALYFDDIEPGSAHQYSVRRVDVFGNPLTSMSPEARVRAQSTTPEGYRNLGRLPVLVATYVDSLPGGAAEADRIEQSLEAARLFVFRHSAGKLLLDLTFLRRHGPHPSTLGPSMALIERDLSSQGIPNNAYGMVFAVVGDAGGSWGNFTLLGKSAGAFGRSGGVPTPPGALGPDPAIAWDFIHELQHVLNEGLASTLGLSGLPTGHFDQDYAERRLGGNSLVFDVGEDWDGQAALLRLTEFWSQLSPPYRMRFEVLDQDGDGLPDADADAPIDEVRFGSSDQADDSDGDGLGDLAELMVGLYLSSDPAQADTDGDGQDDGQDPWPLSDFTGTIPYGNEPRLLATGPSLANRELRLFASWTESHLTLAIETLARSDVFLEIDGSGPFGRWVTDAVVETTDGTLGSDVYMGSAKLCLRAYADPQGVFVGTRRLEETSLEVGTDGTWQRLTVRLPAKLGAGAADVHRREPAIATEGLRLREGTRLGLGVFSRPTRSESPFDPHRHGEGTHSLFELHRLYDAQLMAPVAGDTASPSGG